jgi:hypothetical protein
MSPLLVVTSPLIVIAGSPVVATLESGVLPDDSATVCCVVEDEALLPAVPWFLEVASDRPPPLAAAVLVEPLSLVDVPLSFGGLLSPVFAPVSLLE